MRRRLLVVSNGHGEDLIAAEILRHLPEVDAVAYPLVGSGDAYPPQVPCLDPRRTFPSGGFALRTGMRGFGADLGRGLLRFWLAQRRTLRAQRGETTLTLAVGDTYALAMARLAGAPVVLVASADSVLIQPYGPLQRRIIRGARLVLARDGASAEALRRSGVNAAYLGAASLDFLRFAGTDFGLSPGQDVVTLLPGSRGEAADNAALLGQVAERIARTRPGTQFLMALAPTVAADDVAEAMRGIGARVRDRTATLDGARVTLTEAFADALDRATVVVGLAGTANEQAAGLGKPVVAFPGPGPQFTPRFLEHQHRLLGDALVPAGSAAEAADAVLWLLDHSEERERRGRTGKERIGEAGATERIAALLRDLLRDTAAGST